MTRIHIDPARVEAMIMEMGAIGAHSGTGVWRTVYSPEWVAANDLFARWSSEAGLSVSRDAVGNVSAKLAGTEGGKSIVSGSHIDTQTPGGRYDGTLGALSALIALGSLSDQFGPPKRTLEALSLCEEEGSRFPGANFWGSRAITGAIAPGDAEAMKGYSGETMAEAMRAIGLIPAAIPSARRDDIDSFVELHIEQGPILEHADLPVAIVDAITGLRHYHVTLTGEQNHAGAFPMDLRRDPMAGFAEIASGVINTAHRMGRPAVTTIGRIAADPNGAAVVPSSVSFTVDARHPDPQRRLELYALHEALMREVASRRGLTITWEIGIEKVPCLSDPALVATFREAAAAQGVPTLTMASGAGHDTQQMAKIARTVMIFVRSKDGRSHTPEEFSSIPDIVAGIEVLAAGLYRLAY
ncbi:Zn-dependent hydrolase [Mesorhizobium sp. BR1-1-16]|uniref:Zn-dependent hydrolase n=1 Tax=Mesorhizobium sp. BR1-1-16 TaxID=2876653 RepID=UPI001CCDFE51|nr:Zn-dependent hydrolase [Mesorhizobium sp. BR1-1-16]MBZ9935648.1 Zn-dependent hydrolase [Mesorhizobium sp. BR1-1-16]